MIFQFDNYRDVFIFCMQRQKSLGNKVTFTDLAKVANVQRPYVSKVFNQGAEFNLDQAFNICEFFGLEPKELDFVLKMVEFSRASSSGLRKKLKLEIQALKTEHLKLKKNLDVETEENISEAVPSYYLDPLIQIVHLFLSVSKYKNNPHEIQKNLHISREKMKEILQLLEKGKYIEINSKGQLKVCKEMIHLSDESPLCLPQQILLRTKSLDKLQSTDHDKRLCFSVTFSADEVAQDKIKHRFNSFIKDVQKIVRQAPAEDVYQINFDFFPWS